MDENEKRDLASCRNEHAWESDRYSPNRRNKKVGVFVLERNKGKLDMFLAEQQASGLSFRELASDAEIDNRTG